MRRWWQRPAVLRRRRSRRRTSRAEHEIGARISTISATSDPTTTTTATPTRPRPRHEPDPSPTSPRARPCPSPPPIPHSPREPPALIVAPKPKIRQPSGTALPATRDSTSESRLRRKGRALAASPIGGCGPTSSKRPAGPNPSPASSASSCRATFRCPTRSRTAKATSRAGGAGAWGADLREGATPRRSARCKVTGKRPRMVLDAPQMASRIARLHGAKSTQLVLVDAMRFDLGLRVHERMRDALTSYATCTERLLLWAALPTTTPPARPAGPRPRGAGAAWRAQRARGARLRRPARGTPRRIKVGGRDVSSSTRRGAPARIGSATPERLDASPTRSPSLAAHARTLAPRTLMFVFGDHGFCLEPREGGHPGGTAGRRPKKCWCRRSPGSSGTFTDGLRRRRQPSDRAAAGDARGTPRAHGVRSRRSAGRPGARSVTERRTSSRSAAATSRPSTTAASTKASASSTCATSRPRATPPTATRASPGSPGVCAVTAGPGVTDVVTAVANAQRAGIPMVCHRRRGPAARSRDMGSLQDMDHVDADAPDHEVERAGARDATASASTSTPRSASRRRTCPGPVFLEMPLDLLMNMADDARPPATAPLAAPPRPARRSRASSRGGRAARASAERPVFLVGSQVRWSPRARRARARSPTLRRARST